MPINSPRPCYVLSYNSAPIPTVGNRLHTETAPGRQATLQAILGVLTAPASQGGRGLFCNAAWAAMEADPRHAKLRRKMGC